MAKHSIDMLDVLQQKTEGNRTPEESEEIEAMLTSFAWPTCKWWGKF